MKLRKLFALVLTLCVCASLMAPMASAAVAYEKDGTGKTAYKNITLDATLTSAGSGNYDVSLTATLNMEGKEIANAIAAYITGSSDAALETRLNKLANLRFVCGLSATGIGATGSNFEYNITGDGASIYEKITANDGADGDDLILFHLKLSSDKIQYWAQGGNVQEVQSRICQDLEKTVVFSTTENSKRTGITVNKNTPLDAFVDVYFDGEASAFAQRVAWGTTTLRKSSGGAVGGGGGTTTEPTGPVITPHNDAIGEGTPTSEQLANQSTAYDTARNTIRTTESSDGVVSLSLGDIEAKFAEENLAYRGIEIIDKETGKKIELVDKGNGVYEFSKPVGAYEIVINYIEVPGTPWQTGIESMLNTDEHIAYTLGDNNGNWRPNAAITRAEAATIFYRLLRNKNVDTSAISFSDVSDDMWFATAVKTLAALGILKGDTSGSYRPYATIKRSEFTAICVRFATNEPTDAMREFSDVSSTHWAHDEIGKAAAFGWVIGYPEGVFNPDDMMNRAQAVTLLNRMLGRPGDSEAIASGKGVSFPDVAKTFWAYDAITESATTHGFELDKVTYTETWAD